MPKSSKNRSQSLPKSTPTVAPRCVLKNVLNFSTFLRVFQKGSCAENIINTVSKHHQKTPRDHEKIEPRSLQNRASKTRLRKTPKIAGKKTKKKSPQRGTLGDPKEGQPTKVCLPVALLGGPGTQNASKTSPKGFPSHPKAPFLMIWGRFSPRSLMMLGRCWKVQG